MVSIAHIIHMMNTMDKYTTIQISLYLSELLQRNHLHLAKYDITILPKCLALCGTFY